MDFLICEDEESDQYLLSRFLSPYASSFAFAKGLEETTAMCKIGHYDCLILDLVLKDSTWRGTLDSIRELRALQPKMRLIVCSGMPVEDLKEKAIEAGADVFLKKDGNLFSEGAKQLLIAVNVAMLHATPNDSFWPNVRALREMVKPTS